MIEGYTITTDVKDMDINIIHSYLVGAYWSEGLPLSVLRKSMDNSLCFAVISPGGSQVGFARMITDYATFGYLSDVFVNEAHRGKGLSKLLMKEIMNHPSLQGLRRLMLATKDAHEVYRKFGFTELAAPALFMEVWAPDIYRKH